VYGQRGSAAQDVSYSGGTEDERPSALRDAAAGAPAAGPAVAATPAQGRDQEQNRDAVTGQVVKTEQEKLGRNDPCWCGSGKKFKNCHGR
jgi:preprotein translocase subunit SecA